MSLQDLHDVLVQQTKTGGAIKVSAATLQQAKLTAASGFDATLQKSLVLTTPLTVTVTETIPSPVGNTLGVNGTASFLGLKAAPVSLVFTLETGNTVDLLLEAELPPKWTFSTSFPLVGGFPFSEMAITRPTYLLTTAAQTRHTWQQQTLTLQKGLNFASSLGMGGGLSILKTLITTLDPGVTLTFTGTIDPSGITNLAYGLPALSLTGTIDQKIDVDTHFDLSLPQVLLVSRPDTNGILAYWLTFSTTLSVNSTPFSSFQAAILQNSPTLGFYMLPATRSITPEEIITLIGGVDFTQAIPPVLQQVFSSVSLVGLGAMINTKTLAVIAISGGIGTASPWQMGQFTLEKLAINSMVLSPFATTGKTALTNFTATATIFPTIFTGLFNFEITYDTGSKQMSIAANYQGTVSLNALVAGISNNAVQIPSNFAAIQFDDFGMSFTEAVGSPGTYNYTLYGSAQSTFNITVLGSPIVADFQVSIDSSSKSYMLMGGITLGSAYFLATVDLSGAQQTLSASWTAPGGTSLSVEDILTAVNLGGSLTFPSGLSLALLSAGITYDVTLGTFDITGSFSSDWALDISPVQMAVTDATIAISHGPAPVSGANAGATGANVTTGSIGGTIVFNADVTIAITDTIPGALAIRGQIPQLSLSAAIARLVNMALPLPSGFDLTFSNGTVAIGYGSGTGAANLEFQISANVSGLGAVAFSALKVGAQWGYAAGLSLSNVGISSVPGLSALAPFDSYFVFKQLVFVVSTATLTDFVFPDASVFSGGATTGATIALPKAQGVVAGMNAYADIDLSSQKDLALLMNFLKLSGDLSITLQVGLSDIVNGSALYASMTGAVNGNVMVTGAFGAKLVGGVLELYMSGTVATTLQGSPIVFNFTLVFEPNGAFLSGSYQGTIDFVIVTLSDLIVEIGIDFEGLPSIGFGAQIDVGQFESSVMILLDSVDPLQSMFVACVSDLTLATVLETLCNLASTGSVPASVMSVLGSVGLSGTNSFTLADPDDAVATALNNRDLAAIAQAFGTAGITLPSSSTEVIISVDTTGALWYVTDMAQILHYRLTKSGAGAAVSGELEAQLYVVPQPTQLGATLVPQGFRVNGTLDLFGFTSMLNVDIAPTQGFNIEADLSKLVVMVNGFTVFGFTSVDQTTGPHLSVCTYQNGAVAPHFVANGRLELLGVYGSAVTMNFTPTGGNFTLAESLYGASYTASGSYSATEFTSSGSATIGVDTTINLGGLGNIAVATSVSYSYTIDVALTAQTGSASGSGSFSFQGESFSIPAFALSLSANSLENLPNQVVSDVTTALSAFLGDYHQWLNWLNTGVILGVTTAEQVGQILASTYRLAYATIATETTSVLKYTSTQVAEALNGAGAMADATLDVLVNTLGVAVGTATSEVESIFKGEGFHIDTLHADSTGAHVDNGHADSRGAHVDNGHADSRGAHVDSGGHTDSRGAHVDSRLAHDDTHADTIFGGSHTDHAPHDDTSAHYDTNSPHDDTSAHFDTAHDDTSAHFDTPHDDTSAHFDTPHTDTKA